MNRFYVDKYGRVAELPTGTFADVVAAELDAATVKAALEFLEAARISKTRERYYMDLMRVYS